MYPTLCANLCCWRLSVVDRSLELWLRADDRTRDESALCIVVVVMCVCVFFQAQAVLLDSR